MYLERGSIFFGVAFFGLSFAAHAQTTAPITSNPSPAPSLILDGTTNSKILDGNVIVPATREALRGNNLYHSFSQFNVPSSGVTFGVGDSSIDGNRVTNIINRVSGNQPSLINGGIQSLADFPRANLYLLNPNGIVFSANGSVNLGGSFYATTGTAIGFSNGDILRSDATSLTFSIATPNNVQFAVTQPAPIINQANLTVKAGENITLAGGRIISTGTLSAVSGSVDVAAVSGNNTVTLRSPSAILGLEVRPGVVAPQWQGNIADISQLARLLTGVTSVVEANRAVVNADGSLQLVAESTSSGLGTVVSPGGQLDITGRVDLQPGDLAINLISAGEARLLSSNNLFLLVPNMQTSRSLLLRAENGITLRDSIAKPAIIKTVGNLTFQGTKEIDILALNHPQTAIEAGGLLSLRSNGRVLGDSFFKSGGTLSVRTLQGVSGNFVSALKFEQDAGGTLQFSAFADATLDKLLPNLSGYRPIISVDARAVDGVKNNAPSKSVSEASQGNTEGVTTTPKGTTAKPGNESSNITSLAVQVGLSSLSSLANLSYPGGNVSATNAADLLLQEGRILEAQQALDLSILQEIESYLGKSVARKTLPLDQVSTEQQQLYQTFTNAQTLLAQTLAEIAAISVTSADPQGDRLTTLTQTRKQLETDLEDLVRRPEMTALAKAISAANLRQLQTNLRSLDQGTVLLYPLIRDDRLELILVPPKGEPIRRTTKIDRQKLFQAINTFRNALETVYDPAIDPKTSAQKLYEWLIAPLEADLAKIGAKTILYAPNAQLRYVPLAALFDGDRWLVERFRINNITTASLQDFSAPSLAPKRILAGAVTQATNLKVGDRQIAFEGLPFAQQELDNLSAIFPGTTQLQDNNFSPSLMLEYMSQNTVLHLATHALFRSGRPEESFILFGNNQRQTLADVRKWSLPNVDLVVLSACDTASGQILGDGQEILGFGYLMQQSGAKSAIASLWSVDDGGTQVFMDIFYSLLKQPGMSKAEALRQTQIALITGNFSALGNGAARVENNMRNRVPVTVSEYLNHPYYWAAFILIGNGL